MDKIEEFCNFMQKEAIPFLGNTGKLIGFWTTMVGPSGTFLEIWAFEDFTAYGKAWELLQTEKGKKIMEHLLQYYIDWNFEILAGTPLSPVESIIKQT